jgi:hypothetical protein
VAAFAYGFHLPEYGGCGAYLGVSARFRRAGLATRLMHLLIHMLQVDAACEGTPLPFVILETRLPEATSSAAEWENWRARSRLFRRLEARWVAGVTLLAPSYDPGHRGTVPLHLVLIPVDTCAGDFSAASLREVVLGLFQHVYGLAPGHPLVERSLPPGCHPHLRSIAALTTWKRKEDGKE